ncbi:MAG: glucosamine-6-phosphate deaminase [Erysipelotrichaceae bacterium]|nr:glucosamine-6-phosphate deaminase [Erysipelotrichaceae bacterium]
MKVIKVKDYEEASQKALNIMLDVIKNKPDANLGLATGSTPKRLYESMREDHRINGTSYSDIKTFNLDEYFGLSPDHPQSYYYFMCQNLFDELDINLDNVHVPKGSGDIDEECVNYNQLLNDNPLDIQLLGIGSNGHIGFNEPGTPFESTTHKVDLKESTIKDNARLFFNGNEDEVPKQAVSMGIANIMNAKKILLIACGQNKAKAIKYTIEGKPSIDVPASVLQNHPDCTIIMDEAAASLLETH